MRADIIAAALELGQQTGEEGLTMRAIAARLGVSATALYQHFESKQEILQEIRVYGYDRMAEALEPLMRACAAGGDPQDLLCEMGVVYVNYARENPWLYTVLTEADLIDWDALAPEQSERLFANLRKIADPLCKVVAAAGHQERADAAFFMLWAGFHGAAALMIGGRISASHQALPIPDERAFVRAYCEALVRGVIS